MDFAFTEQQRSDRSDDEVFDSKQAHPNPGGTPREFPGLFVTDRCVDGFLRTVPNIARDEKNLDRPAANAEDHACDETRYRVRPNQQCR